MKKYSSYKESETQWIGEVPKHWNIKKLKWITSNISTGTTPPSDILEYFESGTFNWYTPSDFTEDLALSDSKRKITHLAIEHGKVKPFPKNTVLIVGIGATLGKVGITVKESGSNQQINYISFNSPITAWFIGYFLKANIDSVKVLANSATLPILNQSQTKEIIVPAPPLPEQQAIVTYLDKKTALLDELLRKKEDKIQLLKENRTALINHVVTKGLDDEVEMKDSGVEWIGEVPEYWKQTKLGFYTTKIGSGSTPRGGSEVYVDSGIPFIRSQNVHFDGLRLDGVSYIEQETHVSMKGSTVNQNDVLLNITGGSIGRCCVVNNTEEMNVNQHVSIIRTKQKLNPVFLNYILGADIGQSQVLYNISGGNREGLTIEGIRDFIIAIPPLSEQHQIVTYLNEQTQLIDQTIQHEVKKIELLKEYRQSLISEVVTGKVCVLND